MRVWLFTQEFGDDLKGGLGVALNNLTISMAEHGLIEPIVIFPKSGGKPRIDRWRGIPVLTLPWRQEPETAPATLPPALRYLPRPDLIHTHTPVLWPLVRAARLQHECPLVYTSHSTIRDEFAGRSPSAWEAWAWDCQLALYGAADAVICPSHSEARKVAAAAQPSTLAVVPHGIAARPEAVRPPAKDGPRLLFVGRIVREKGPEVAIRALAKLRPQFPGANLTVVGAINAYADKLQSLCHQLGVDDAVKFVGWRHPELLDEYYSQADAVLVPSHRESFGLVAWEALAAGVPVVAARVGGLADYLTNCAILVPPDDAEALANGVAQLLTDEQRRHRLVAAGLALVQAHPWALAAERTKAVYAELLPARPTRRNNSAQWRVLKPFSEKKQGRVWVVARGNERGYFKFTGTDNEEWGGPVAANEWVAARLARLARLPAARVEEATIEGQQGVVSVQRPGFDITWRQIADAGWRNPQAVLADAHLWLRVVAFDVWIGNIDRASGKNIVVGPGDPPQRPWYLIDHGHAVHGNRRRWRQHPPNSEYWRRIANYYDPPIGFDAIVSGAWTDVWKMLQPEVRAIQRISRHAWRRIVDAVPPGLWSPADAAFVTEWLGWRQQQLGTLIRAWVEERYGKQPEDRPVSLTQ